MGHKLFRLDRFIRPFHHIGSETLIAVLIALFLVVTPTGAKRFQERSLYVQDNSPAARTSHTVSFQYMSPDAIGSVEMLYCLDPIPYNPCVTPPGLDVSGVSLSGQSGETGYSIQSASTNRIVLTRLPTFISGTGNASYTLDNIRNPSITSEPFSIRLKSHASTNASGQQVDFGTVRGQITESVEIATQVPPMLIFCLAEEVENSCVSTNENYYAELGELNAGSTLKTQSQMAIGTNASGGFAITANGGPPSAGTNIIASSKSPTVSQPGTNQFGMNLVENTAPSIGNNPEGVWTNAVPSPDYNQTNRYTYNSGDVVASSPNVSLMKKFTVSYIINSEPNLRPGVYTTTIVYIASGRF